MPIVDQRTLNDEYFIAEILSYCRYDRVVPSVIDLSIVVIYLGIMLAIGYMVSKYITSFHDFFLAGRAMTMPILICTLVSTYYGLDITFGNSEMGFYEGIVEWFLVARPYYIAILFAALFLSVKIKKFHYKAHSLPGILGEFYGDKTQIFGAIGTFIYAVPIMGLMGFGVLFSQFFGMEYLTGVIVGAVLSTIYTLMGGFWADVLTDSVQFVIMCVSIAVAIPLALNMVGGHAGLYASLPEVFWKTTGDSADWLYYAALSSTALSVLVEPAFFHRVFAAKRINEVRNALLFGIVIWMAYDWGVTILGMAAKAAVVQGLLPVDLEGKEALIRLLLMSLPIGLKGFFMAGLLSAAMSTVDSYLLISSDNLVSDIYSKFRKGEPLSDKSLLLLTRWGVVLSIIPCVILSVTFERITSAWLFMTAALSSSVLPPLLLGLYFPKLRVSSAGLWSSCVGLLSVLAIYVSVQIMGVYDPEFDAYAVTFLWKGHPWTFRAEYTLFISLPLSLLAFGLGYLKSKWQHREVHHG
jgi:solute:Na+ symporter, SSS family